MATSSVYASDDAQLYGDSASGVYATAHGTSSSYDDGSDAAFVGQLDDGASYIAVQRLLLPFVLALGAGATISAATIYITKATTEGNINTNFKIVRVSGAALPASSNRETDFDAILAGTNEGVIGNPATWSNDVTKSLAIDPSYLNPNGTNFYGLLTSTDLAASAPPAGKDETLNIYTSRAATSGYRPTLEVTYTLPSYSPTWALTLLGVGG